VMCKETSLEMPSSFFWSLSAHILSYFYVSGYDVSKSTTLLVILLR
jgi:hypothetical protein